jgi:hypothetical protein
MDNQKNPAPMDHQFKKTSDWPSARALYQRNSDAKITYLVSVFNTEAFKEQAREIGGVDVSSNMDTVFVVKATYDGIKNLDQNSNVEKFSLAR